MCGRYIAPDVATIEREYRIDGRTPHPLARNIYTRPTNAVPVLLETADGAMHLEAGRWGLIPAWWKQDKAPALTFNARGEEAAGKPMWRGPWRQSRCLLPAEGWYEWRDKVDAETGEVIINPKTKKPARQKYRITPMDGGLIAFAGLYSPKTDKAATDLSTTIVTHAAHGPIAWLHDRMPCVLPREAWRRWMDPALTDPDQVGEILKECREDFEAQAIE